MANATLRVSVAYAYGTLRERFSDTTALSASQVKVLKAFGCLSFSVS
jgi:hypothetical protein